MRRIAAGLLSLALLAGCSASGTADDEAQGTTTGSTDEPTATTGAPGERPEATIDWQPCDGGFECGTLEVPLDHADPDGPTIEVAVNRHLAEDPSQRIGVLIMNPGGPGASGLELARSFPRAGAIGDRFDIVGFDPRGVGQSTPLDCNTHLQAIYDADPTIDSPEDEQATLESSQAFVDECEERHSDLLPHLGTTQVAADIDAIRAALGEDQINYLGYSYGTSIGQEYARQFPERVRAMILDGVVDHEPDGIDTALGQAAGFDRAFGSYVENCEQEGCGLDAPADQVVDEVIAASEQQPIPSATADRAATPGVVSLALAQALYSQQLWGTLSAALRNAVDGDGSGLVDLADMYLGREGDEYTGGFEAYFAVSCLDETWPDDPQDVIAESLAAQESIARFGGPIVIDYIRCAMWPADAQPLAPVPADLEGLAPILVVSTTNDPATPYENGVRVAEQIPGAVLVTNEGEGHTIVALGKPCIDDIATAYLVDLELPDDATTCPE
jgi:pimeloyl-ACP methyl ester carboxylesterase